MTTRQYLSINIKYRLLDLILAAFGVFFGICSTVFADESLFLLIFGIIVLVGSIAGLLFLLKELQFALIANGKVTVKNIYGKLNEIDLTEIGHVCTKPLLLRIGPKGNNSYKSCLILFIKNESNTYKFNVANTDVPNKKGLRYIVLLDSDKNRLIVSKAFKDITGMDLTINIG